MIDMRAVRIRQKLDARAYVRQANRILERSGQALADRNGWQGSAALYIPAPFTRGSVLTFGAQGATGTTAQ
jgi:hypothetical protein